MIDRFTRSRAARWVLAGSWALLACFSAAAQPKTEALPAGRSLQLDKRAVRLLDAQGHELASWKLRPKHMDLRVLDRDSLAVVGDADTGQPVLLRIAHDNGRAQRLAALPSPSFAPAALCLYQDPQRLLHLFLLADNGLSEQWLLRQEGQHYEAVLLRRLATPLAPASCHVDDASQALLIQEPGVGWWAYRAEAEGAPERRWLSGPPQPNVAPLLPPTSALPIVLPLAQTQAVPSPGDAADDPAIWEHPRDTHLSRVLATDKKLGLLVYDLAGRELQRLPVGRVNNVDLRQGLKVDGGPERFDLAVATHRDEDKLVLFGIDGQGRVSELARLATEIHDLYGVCVGRSPEGLLDIFVNNKDGELRQYRVERVAGAWQARVVRSHKFDSQPEGCVVDEVQQRVFVGEEKRGVWSLSTDLTQAVDARLVLPLGGLLVADVEGMGLYRRGDAAYLVVSSQGNHSYVVMDAAPPHRVRGAFRVGINTERRIDGASETDGLAVSAKAFGPLYREGLLVVQDGHKHWPDAHQNFKYVPWEAVRKALELP